MFTAFFVFARGAPRGKAEPPTALVDSWCPDQQPLDAVLQAAGLPRSALLQEFCFPKKGAVAPQTMLFSFTLTTNQAAERAYGFCLRTRAVDTDRFDVGGDAVETSCFVSRHPFFKMFPLALQIVRVRRVLDRLSAMDFIAKLHATSSFVAPRVSLESTFCGMNSRYELPMLKEPNLACLFSSTNPVMLHYIMGVILLERRIVFVAQNEAILSSTINALIFLLCSDSFFPSILVPIVPSTMLEQGVSSPTPFVVGILRTHLKVIDAIPQLGDLVIIDLDRIQVRLAPGASPIVPFGIASDQDGGGIQRRGSSGGPGTDEPRPWADVCGPFSKDIVLAYANRDEDLLRSSVRSVLSIVIDGSHLDDPILARFYPLYRRTQLSKLLQPEVTSLGSRGYSAVRQLLSSNLAQASARDRHLGMESKGFVEQLTSSNSTLKRGPEMLRVQAEVAKRSFDVWIHEEVADMVLKSRLADCAGRNWKLGFRAMGVFDMLARAGSEVALASMWDNLPVVFAQTRFSTQGVVGLPSRVTVVMRKRATQLYSLLVDVAELRYLRSLQAHALMVRFERARMQQSVARLPLGRMSLRELLDKTKPMGVPSMSPVAALSGNDQANNRDSPNPFDGPDLLGMGFVRASSSSGPPPLPPKPKSLESTRSVESSKSIESSKSTDDSLDVFFSGMNVGR